MPEHLFPPPFPSGYEPWLDAFWSASTERQYGMGVGPIPASALRDAACDLGLDEVETEMFVSVARRLDQIYLADASKRTGEGGKSAPAQVSSRPMSLGLFDALFG